MDSLNINIQSQMGMIETVLIFACYGIVIFLMYFFIRIMLWNKIKRFIPKRCFWCGRLYHLPLTFQGIWCDKLREGKLSIVQLREENRIWDFINKYQGELFNTRDGKKFIKFYINYLKKCKE